jgi:diguanylate cyclase (GGDEF)-like protein
MDHNFKMQTRNHCYTDKASLAEFIKNGCYFNNKNLLIQVFSADTALEHLPSIVQTLKAMLPQAVVIGATTDGEIVNGRASTETSILSFTQFTDTRITATIYPIADPQFKLGQKIATEQCHKNTQVMILLADGLLTNGEDLLDGIYDVNQAVIVAGGLAGDYRRMQKTLVICQDKIEANAVVVCALHNENLQVNTRSVLGWQPIGKSMLVTKSLGNRLIELDGQPLRHIYEKYLGPEVANALPASAGEYPLMINRFEKYITRAALHLFEDGSMQYAGNFNIGDKVQFGYGHIPFILSKIQSNIEELSEMPIESIFVYSCSSRKYFLGNEVNKELLPLEFLSNTAGFFTYGEFFHGNKKNELLNETMTLLILSETDKVNTKELANIVLEEKIYQKNTYSHLFHLIDATSTELTQANDRLEMLVSEKTKQILDKVYFDDLTHLPNRNRLLEDISSKTAFNPTFLASLSIDDFRAINDCYGDKIADKILLEVASRLKDLLQASLYSADLKLYKMPIDEFVIAANERVFTRDFLELFEVKLEQAFSTEIVAENNKFLIRFVAGISLGRVESTDYLQDSEGILSQSYMALREAKNTQARQYIYHANMTIKQDIEHNLEWTKKIKAAIREDRFVPYFQPIYAAKTHQVEKYECLIRMVDIDGSIVTPYLFLDIAKRAKLYLDLTKIMLDKCFVVFSKNHQNLSLNLSITDIQDEKLMAYLMDKIKEYKIGTQLTIEILESESINNYAILDSFIKQVKEFGCKIAMDDFGSGYSSLTRILKMDIDYIKIDGSLIKNVCTDPKVKIMVEMLIDFCKKFNIKSVAEFVSDKNILDAVSAMDVDYLQGFYLGEPAATILS